MSTNEFGRSAGDWDNGAWDVTGGTSGDFSTSPMTEVEFCGGPWDGHVTFMSAATLTPRRHMPGRTDGVPAELVTYALSGHHYIYRPDRADREDT